MAQQIDKAAILDAFDQLAGERRKHWIGGMPDQDAIKAIVRDIAHSFGIDKAEVHTHIEARTKLALSQ